MPTQVERFAVFLKELRPDVTEDDRIAAQKRLKVSYNTISGYINGKGKNNDTALKLITFFKERIAERDKIAVWVPPLQSNKQQEVAFT